MIRTTGGPCHRFNNFIFEFSCFITRTYTSYNILKKHLLKKMICHGKKRFFHKNWFKNISFTKEIRNKIHTPIFNNGYILFKFFTTNKLFNKLFLKLL